MSCSPGKAAKTWQIEGSSWLPAATPPPLNLPTPSLELVERMAKTMEVALPEITCEEDMAAVLEVLDREARHPRWRSPNETCGRADMIRRYLQDPYRHVSPENMMSFGYSE